VGPWRFIVEQARRISLLGLFFAFAATAAAVAEYFPPPFFVLAGRSDLIVVGTIVEVSRKTFTLRVEEVLAGSVRSKEIEVLRFQDWICSTRWKPYEAGQREVAFLYKLDRSEARKTGAKYGTMSAGDEGEWEIVDEEVSVQGFAIPGGREFNEGEHPGQWFPLDVVLDAIRRFRRCLSVVAGESVWTSQARLTCSARELSAYRSTSQVHEYLVSTALGGARW
jgi:hypothetical protein